MKRYFSKVYGAQVIGTTFYKTNIQDIIKTLESTGFNVFCLAALEHFGYKALDTKSMYGSYIDDKDLYICVTDGELINVNGEEVEPEYAMEEYYPEDLAEYIQDATDDVIKKHITEYEILLIDIDELAVDLLNDGHTFQELYEAATDLDIYK